MTFQSCAQYKVSKFTKIFELNDVLISCFANGACFKVYQELGQFDFPLYNNDAKLLTAELAVLIKISRPNRFLSDRSRIRGIPQNNWLAHQI